MIRVREVENLACYLDSARAICGIEPPPLRRRNNKLEFRLSAFVGNAAIGI